jgi:DNA-binding MltR family transcriptional regulator
MAITQSDIITIFGKTSQAAHVLVIAGLIEDELEKLLSAAAASLDKDSSKRIFGFRGPLGDFSSKIDVAYMFKLIDEPIWRDLHVLRKVRNTFAHTSQYLDFEAEPVVRDCRKLSNWESGKNQESYFEKAAECANAIRAKLASLMLARALSEEPSVQLGSE